MRDRRVHQGVQVGLGLVVEDELSEHSYILLHVHVSILQTVMTSQNYTGV